MTTSYTKKLIDYVFTYRLIFSGFLINLYSIFQVIRHKRRQHYASDLKNKEFDDMSRLQYYNLLHHQRHIKKDSRWTAQESQAASSDNLVAPLFKEEMLPLEPWLRDNLKCKYFISYVK